MKRLRTPTPSPSFRKLVAVDGIRYFEGTISGEITASSGRIPMGSCPVGGQIRDVWLSVGTSGKDDTNTLSLDVDVKINGTTCLTTKPKIAHVSGEVSQQKTTVVAGDTGLTHAVLAAANSFSPGDVISFNATLTRVASPTTEMANACIVVEVEPNK